MNDQNSPQDEPVSNLRSCLTVLLLGVLCVVLPALLVHGVRHLLGGS